jgi:RNA polymerase sigma factor (sigma-70 family)
VANGLQDGHPTSEQERVADSRVLMHRIDVTTLTKADVYEKYADQLIRFATGLVGPSDGRDVMATAVLNAMWSPGWGSVVNERAYLYTSVLNEARRHHRDNVRRGVMELRTAASRDTEGLLDIRPDVLKAVARLSVSQRAVVFLAYWEDMRPAEIARHLGLSEGTVHRQLGRGQARLRRMLHE